jgi:hypothetical protein
MIIEFIILVYLMANCFFAGYLFAEDSPYYNVILAILFGCFIIIFAALWGFVNSVRDLLNHHFQLSFWFTYYLGNGWKNLDKEKLEDLNQFAEKSKHRKELRYRIYRKCVELTNKANNYKHDPTSAK